MRRFAITILAAALLACGGSDTADTADTDADGMAGMTAEEHADHMADTGAAEATGSGGTTRLPPTGPIPTNPALTTPACLSLVAAGKLEQALKPCLAALEADPDNPELQAAVAKAEAAKAALGDTAAGAGTMVDDAAAALE